MMLNIQEYRPINIIIGNIGLLILSICKLAYKVGKSRGGAIVWREEDRALSDLHLSDLCHKKQIPMKQLYFIIN